MLRGALLRASRSARLRRAVQNTPVTRAVVQRFVAGGTTADAVRVAGALVASGRRVSLDHLGEDTRDRDQADQVRTAYLRLLTALADAGLTQGGRCEVSVKLSAIGQALAADSRRITLENARSVCAAARAAGTMVTLDMEDHATVDSTLAVLADLRADFPDVGAVLQAHLHRTEADCRDLAVAGSRVRLCKGAYDEPASVAYPDPTEVGRSYVRCLKVLMAGPGYPMVATHDPRLVDIAGALAVQEGREQGSYEYQMLYGVRAPEQVRLTRAGETVRVYLPYGQDWYGYLMRRMAERPANAAFFLRAVVGRR